MNIESKILEDLRKMNITRLLLSNNDKSGLFKTDEYNQLIELEFPDEKSYQINFKSQKQKNQYQTQLTLIDVGRTYLGLQNPTEDEVLKFFIRPEMEVERIFNVLRYKYLQAIDISNFSDPSRLISSDCNNAFQSLAGVNVYQGNTKFRVRDNKSFYNGQGFPERSNQTLKLQLLCEALNGKGFTDDASSIFNNGQEKDDLGFILDYIRNYYVKPSEQASLYAELIAIKPGFHEMLVHCDYFNDEDKNRCNPFNNTKDREREQIFKSLRNNGELENFNWVKKTWSGINKKDYLSYAACAITEGPFVFRKNIGTSYFEEIRNVKKEQDKANLESKFYILDYSHNDAKPKNNAELRNILQQAEKFNNYLID